VSGAAIDCHVWFQRIDFGHACVSNGSKRLELLAAEQEAHFDCLDRRGQSVLDIGAWNRAFSFRAKRASESPG
jgi:hypothetical protein